MVSSDGSTSESERRIICMECSNSLGVARIEQNNSCTINLWKYQLAYQTLDLKSNTMDFVVVLGLHLLESAQNQATWRFYLGNLSTSQLDLLIWVINPKVTVTLPSLEPTKVKYITFEGLKVLYKSVTSAENATQTTTFWYDQEQCSQLNQFLKHSTAQLPSSRRQMRGHSSGYIPTFMY